MPLTRAMVAPRHPPISKLNLALLAGGRSTRMGSDKFLLEYPDGTPVYLNRLRMLQEAFPKADRICIVLRDSSRAEHVRIPPEMGVHVLFVAPTVGAAHVAGPAAGLHTLYCFDPASHWLVIPCDYPLLRGEDLTDLYHHYRDPVTCFANSQRSTEPIVAIWSPGALAHLTVTAVENRSGLSNLMLRLGGHTIPPRYDHCLFNTNTREEWDDALLLLKAMQQTSLPNSSQD
ncbi:nucleotide-diphospho-sugar transferase [Westerdykella ornata]|uniref:Nucleotide-diphospho-sugar transferase n=1 Tax=Westerdykella ornata TaxID=318751 RepID=A0A6A6JRX1_WESOR|nr:nucleotide-diphospho-sugar transferase [Westerdykella ornata]KAF2279312.1 nucleotide-diphospho-sugar transferase [Westerdykella ornata]